MAVDNEICQLLFLRVLLILIMYEHFFQCPYCWEEISMLLDPSIPAQSYVEDCEVCCNPILVSLVFNNQELIGFKAVDIG